MFDGKILVVGGSGFVGANLVRRLVMQGVDVRATLHRKSRVVIDERIEYVQSDLMKMEDCRRIVDGVSMVFMCSANTSGAAVMASTPLVHVTPNLVMNAQLLEAAYDADVNKFVWISSGAAYPPSGEKPVHEDELMIGDPPDVYFPVAWMKRYTEILCRMYSQKLKKTMPTVVVRPSNIFGPYDDFEPGTSHMMAALIRKVVDRMDPLEVWGTGNDIKDHIYIDDFIDGLLLAADKLNDYIPVNIASGQGHSVNEVLNAILEVDGYENARIIHNPSKPSMLPIRLFDSSRAQELLGFKARTSLKEGIGKTLDWYRHSGLEMSASAE